MSKKKNSVEEKNIVDQNLTDTEPVQNGNADLSENSDAAEEKPVKVGTVTGCSRLNIRQGPNIKSPILGEVTVLSELKIDESESTKEWFKVCTEKGVDGYCMKKYVSLNQ